MRRLFCFAALTLLLASSVAFAQLSTAQLSGRVTDESGAVLPGVTVTAIQTDTGVSRSDVTDGNGSYQLPNLPTSVELGLKDMEQVTLWLGLHAPKQTPAPILNKLRDALTASLRADSESCFPTPSCSSE